MQNTADAEPNAESIFSAFVRFAIATLGGFDPPMAQHSERVAAMAAGLAASINDSGGLGSSGAMRFSADEMREIRCAGILHEFGMVCVRQLLLAKGKKLYDSQLEFIRLRFAYARKALEAEHSRRQLSLALQDRDQYLAAASQLEADFQEKLVRLQEDLAEVIKANEATVLTEETAERLAQLAQTHVDIEGTERPLLEPHELMALSVRRGSMTEPERVEIESGVSHSFRLLSLMPWPSQLERVPLIVGANRERLDGTGYPSGLHGDEIPLQSRMITIACIYDVLTAADRPNKRALPSDRALDILNAEASANHLDSDLVDIFVGRRVFDIAATVAERQARGESTDPFEF